jgi:hypothetical protein
VLRNDLICINPMRSRCVKPTVSTSRMSTFFISLRSPKSGAQNTTTIPKLRKIVNLMSYPF